MPSNILPVDSSLFSAISVSPLAFLLALCSSWSAAAGHPLAFVARPLFSRSLYERIRVPRSNVCLPRHCVCVCVCTRICMRTYTYTKTEGTLVLERAMHTSTIGGRTRRMRPSLALKKVPLSPSDLSRRANEASFHR